MSKVAGRIGPHTEISEDRTYCLTAHYKDGDGEPFVKVVGSFNDCMDYECRNTSPDNPERYVLREYNQSAQ